MPTNPTPVDVSTQSVTEGGRSLQAPGGAFFSSQKPMTAGSLRGLVLAIVGAVITEVIVLLGNGTVDLPQWAVAFVPMTIIVLRMIEAYIDQSKVV
jgi:hypothetical protein